MKIFIGHPYYRSNQYSQLASDYASAVTTVKVKNTDGFVTTKYAVLGAVGYEQAELVQTGTVTSPDTLAGFTTLYPHNADDRVTVFDYNQIKIYRSTTGINGTYSLLGSPINIQIDHDATPFEDTTSQSTYYYKFSYYNSTSLLESDLSDPISATGFSFYSAKTLIDRILSLFGDAKAEFVSRDEVMGYLNEFYERAQRKHTIATKRLNIKWDTITLVSGTDEYSLFSDFLMEKGLKVSLDNGSTYPLSCASMNTDSVGHIENTNIRYGYSIYGSTIKFDPIPQAADLVKVFYVPTPTLFSLETDTLLSPFQNTTSMFIKYGLAMCKLKDGKTEEYQVLQKRADDELEEFLSFVKQMQNKHLRYVEITDTYHN